MSDAMSAIGGIFSIIGFIIVIYSMILVVKNLMSHQQSSWGGVLLSFVAGMIFISFKSFLGFIMGTGNGILEVLEGNPTSSASPETPVPTPSPTLAPTQAPSIAVDHEPVNLPWEFLLFSLVGIVGLIIVIGTLSFLIKKYRVNHNQKKDFISGWLRLIDIHDEVLKSWTSYETDIVKVIDNPFMFDMREKMVQDFIAALNKSNAIRPSNIKNVSNISSNNTPYEKSVFTVQTAFTVLEAESKKVKWNNFTEGERKRIKTAQNLFNIAMDTATSQAERQLAYKRAIKELEGLLVIPKATILQLEATKQLSLTA